MKKGIFWVLVFFIGVSFMGCASIMHGTKEDVKIDAYPQGAVFKVLDDKGVVVASGYVPQSVKLKRNGKYYVIVGAKGYQEVKVPIERKVSGAYFGNLLFGGPLGLIIGFFRN